MWYKLNMFYLKKKQQQQIIKKITYALITLVCITRGSGNLDGRLAGGKAGWNWWWWCDEWYQKAICCVGVFDGKLGIETILCGIFCGIDDIEPEPPADTSWWCDDKLIGKFVSSIVTWCCILDILAGEEWWLRVSGDTIALPGDDGDGTSCVDVDSIALLIFKKIFFFI